MATIDLETYDSWSLQLPVVPRRSRLYYLEPIGVGTSYVESLTGYICRLALAHCVSPRTLIRQEILPMSNQSSKNQSCVTKFPSVEFAVNINGRGVVAQKYVQGLKSLTLKGNLQSLTMLAWKWKTLAGGGDPTTHLRAWCPECYQDWRSAQQPMYEPLLWSLAAVTVCPRHRKRLQSKCPHCGQQQRLIAGKMRPGYCSKCQQWLGCLSDFEPSDEAVIALELEWHIWVAERIGEVLALASTSLPRTIRSNITDVIYGKEEPYISDFQNKAMRRLQFNLLAMFAH